MPEKIYFFAVEPNVQRVRSDRIPLLLLGQSRTQSPMVETTQCVSGCILVYKCVCCSMLYSILGVNAGIMFNLAQAVGSGPAPSS